METQGARLKIPSHECRDVTGMTFRISQKSDKRYEILSTSLTKTTNEDWQGPAKNRFGYKNLYLESRISDSLILTLQINNILILILN